MEFLNALTFWHWLLIGLVCLVLEMLMPSGVFFLWMGVAGIVLGGLTYFVTGLAWEAQIFVFGVLSVVFAVLGRVYVKKFPIETDRPRLNRRGEQYVDRVFTLEAPIVNHEGKISVDDSTWKIRGQDCPEGTRVKVTRADGVLLHVDIVSAD
ncbi:MAG: NfeD family protein [Pseudomonadota bacterium]